MTRACPSCVLVRCVAAKGQAQARGPRQETEYRETERVSSLCPRSSRDWQPLTTAREKRERERDGTAIERPPLSVCSWDRIEQKGAGRTRPESTPESPFLSDFRTDQFFSLSLSLSSALLHSSPEEERPRNLEKAILEFGFRGTTFPPPSRRIERRAVSVSTTLERVSLFALRPR